LFDVIWRPNKKKQLGSRKKRVLTEDGEKNNSHLKKQMIYEAF